MSRQEYEFEYVCADCKGKFSFFFTDLEIQCGIKPACPHCQSYDMIKVFGKPSANTVRGNYGSGCNPLSGPGCC